VKKLKNDEGAALHEHIEDRSRAKPRIVKHEILTSRMSRPISIHPSINNMNNGEMQWPITNWRINMQRAIIS